MEKKYVFWETEIKNNFATLTYLHQGAESFLKI